jgi:hypothetical protein
MFKPQNIEEIEVANGSQSKSAPPKKSEPEEIKPDDDADFSDFIDREIFDSIEMPTGDIEDELKSARRLRHVLERIVYAWRPQTITDPRSAKLLQDYVSLLTRQLAVIGRLDADLVRQRMRNGQLLDSESANEFARRLANSHRDLFEGFWREALESAITEFRELVAVAEIDVPINSDKLLKTGKKIMRDWLKRDAELGPKIAAEIAAEQGQRLGAGDE